MKKVFGVPIEMRGLFFLLMLLFLGGTFFFPSGGAASSNSVFGTPVPPEGKEGKTIILNFASLGERKEDWGHSRVVEDSFQVFVRDRNVTQNWFFGLPEKMSSKSNWEVSLVVTRFEVEYFGVAFGGLFPGSSKRLTHAAVMLPLRGGRVLVRHTYPMRFDASIIHDIVDVFESGHEIRAVRLPATIQFLYDGLEQQCTVLVNGEKVLSYSFASFKNRLPWNITHIAPQIMTGEKTPVRIELESAFAVRAW